MICGLCCCRTPRLGIDFTFAWDNNNIDNNNNDNNKNDKNPHLNFWKETALGIRNKG